MFGYIEPFKSELRVVDYEIYKGVYCGLCRALSKDYGPAASFVLSYDFTFTAMLHLALNSESPDIIPGRCPYSPLSTRPLLSDGLELRFSAAVAAIMIYYKVLDDIDDMGIVKGSLSRVALPFVKSAHKKAAMLYPEADAAVADAMKEQKAVESRRDVSLDMASEPTSKALSALFEMMSPDETSRRILSRLGYMIGRYVYCCDAASDLKEDKASGNFNPLLISGYDAEAIKTSLYLTQAEALAAFELLEIKSMKEILLNIMTLGMRQTTDSVLRGVYTYEQSL